MARAPLPDAAFLGDTEKVRELLEMGHDVDEADEFGWAPLHRAVESGNVDTLKVLIDHGADCDALTPAQSTAFHIAALHGFTEMAMELIDADDTPNVNEENINGSTPIMAAAFNVNPTMLKILLDQEAEVTECDEDGWNCLHFLAWNAGKKGSAECAELLLKAGAKVMERVSVCHAEEDSQMDRRGEMASGIVRRRLKLMSDVEAENAREMLATLKTWEDIMLEKMAKAQAKAKDKAAYETAMDNAKRRSSIRRKSSVVKPK